MPVFRDTDQLYEVLGAFFERLMQRADVADALVKGSFVLRFRYTEPEGQVTIDLRSLPITWAFGESDLSPDLEMIQSADTAHEFWLGHLNVPMALAARRVVSRGSVAKALALLPAVEPAYPLYASVLEELGLEELVPDDKPRRSPLWLKAAKRLSGLRRAARPRGTRADRSLSQRHLPTIPLLEGAGKDTALRDQGLPTEADELKREMLARMLLVRAFEEHLAGAYARGELPTEAIHLSLGQEATAVGACFALRSADHMATTHRGHGHMLAKGADLYGMAAELLAKHDGLCGGKGGSMHVTDASVGAIGANGIVGASPLIATGAARSARLLGTGAVAAAFLGDGATNQGMFHEAMNFAAVFSLPALFVVENNGYGEFTPLDRHTRVTRLADRAAAYGMPGLTVDGNDVWAVYEATRAAAERARRGEGPTLIECLTYRWCGHMEGEDADYRSAEEIAAWRDRCPIASWRARLVEEGVVSEDEAGRLAGEARARVTEAFARAGAASDPPPEALWTDVYAPDPPELLEPPPVADNDHKATYSQAVFEALSEELERDDSTYLLGEDVSTGGYFAVTAGLVERFGPDRIVDTPISEYAIVGSAVGAAMTGARPVAEILFSDFLTTAMDPLVNQAAKLRYMSGGQYKLPLVVRTPGGGGLGMAAQHSQSLEAWLTGVPGLVVCAPATPFDAKGMLKAAIRSNNPVLFFENKLLYASTGPVGGPGALVPLGVAEVKREGSDLTLVSAGAALGKALLAADAVAAEGVDVEVVDVRTLVPLDLRTILSSVEKTGRLVTVEEGALFHGFGAEIVARVSELCWGALRSAPRRVAARDVPIPYNPALETAALLDVERICEACRAV